MATKNVQLPELGEGVTEGELVKWLVKVGDKISPDQPVAEMMTDKATVEVPSPFAGVVKEISKKEGDVVEVGATMLVLETDASAGASAPAATAAKPEAPKPAAVAAQPAAMAASAPAPAAARTSGGAELYPPVADARVLATPATRRLARESGVDLNQVRGTGVAGRVTRDDVMGSLGAGAVSAGTPSYAGGGASALQAPSISRPGYQSPAGALDERVPLKGIRKKIAENMQMAKHIVPHFTLMDEANVTALVAMRSELKSVGEKHGVKITYLPFVMKALIATIREFPMFNASIDDAAQEIVYKKYFNLGFAADTPNGLLVPVIKNADQKTIIQLSREIGDLAKRARDGKLALDEMKGATVTVTNIGSVGGQYATPIINHPEVAIMGMYKIQEKPVIKRDASGAMSLDAIQTMNFTITADHRLIDGAVAANFLKAFITRIENPGVLMLDMI
ncbi:MAG: dihydrolipoamide acetyltransferase family protein [Bdellovibrionales bacterium]|jgi:pyruvate dehydrogenase E2 component (dihydrolipoamide acetyltransferase)|nr:dihydrolipoamide acetyltransferase family protein [Bdellovibrionales bacterium]